MTHTDHSSDPPVPAKSERLASLDQFRGYSVAAMFVVNFLGGLTITHQLLRHNNTHFSLADSIMPSFIFACGFSYRMSFLKLLGNVSGARPRLRFVKRSFGLILLSIMLTGFNTKFASWTEMSPERMTRFFLEWIKADLWEVLAIIGAIQVLLLPVISKPTWLRVVAFVGLGIAHVALSWSFNYDFVYGRPNWMDGYFGKVVKRAWDGGLFGLLSWSQIMLAGTLAFDMMQRCSQRVAIHRLFVVGATLMLCGYCLSCLTTLYDLKGLPEEQALSIRSSPVFPDFSLAKGKAWSELLASPPFFTPPLPNERVPSYWAMDKRVVSQPFVLFSTGFAVSLFAIFVFVCDVHGGSLRVFEVFGKNPLASYIIHHLVAHSILEIVPKDSPLHWSLIGLIASFGITYLFVRFLESRNLILRL